MFPVPSRQQLTAVVLILFALAPLASIANTEQTAARPAAVETPQIEPTVGTVPPLTFVMWFPQVMGSHYEVGIMPTK